MSSYTPFPLASNHGVAKQHVHLGDSVPTYRPWEMGQMRSIRRLGTYDPFVQPTRRHPDTITSLDDYLRVFALVEAIQSGPEAVRESSKSPSEVRLARAVCAAWALAGKVLTPNRCLGALARRSCMVSTGTCTIPTA